MVAAVCTWHEHHAAVAAAIETRLARRRRLAVAAHALAEAYAVLTRLPAPHRLAPTDAWALLSTNFVTGNTGALAGAAYVALLADAAARGVSGGRIYDVIIGASSAEAGARELLTLNPRHFDPPPAGLTITDPAAAM
jgi:predicted nucleic acid-binding protein